MKYYEYYCPLHTLPRYSIQFLGIVQNTDFDPAATRYKASCDSCFTAVVTFCEDVILHSGPIRHRLMPPLERPRMYGTGFLLHLYVA